jgi:hypothetical protein
VLLVALFLQEQRRKHHSQHAPHHQPQLVWSATALQMMALTGSAAWGRLQQLAKPHSSCSSSWRQCMCQLEV